MRFGSVCSGIEAATQAWAPLGWQPAFYSEMEKFPRAVLQHHHPDVPLHGDFTTIGAKDYGPIDLLCGGTPCQSFSVAGLRGGMDDERGNLSLGYCRLVERKQPRWVVWENVPGVLSSNGGRDFGSIVGALVKLGYGVCWRVLDAQYVRVDGFARAVPQRRRRVVLVGYLGDERCARAVLFERESLQGHTAPRRKARQVVTGTLSARSQGGGGLGTDFEVDGGLVARTLLGKGNSSHASDVETYVAHTLRGEGFDASEDGTGRGTPLVPEVSPALKARDHKGPSSDGDGDGAPILPVAFDCKGTEVQFCEDGSHPTLRSMGHKDSHSNAGGHAAVYYDLRGRDIGAQLEGPHQTANIRAASGGSSRSYVQAASAVRRLTPRECERLMGFPEIENNIILRICRNFSVQIKHDALAATKCLKSQNSASIVDANGLRPTVLSAEPPSATSPADLEKPVAVHVLIELERGVVQVRSAERSASFAIGAERQNKCPLPTQIESFAHLHALMKPIAGKLIQTGKAVSLQSTQSSILAQSGSVFAIVSGDEIEVPASDVESAINEAIQCSMSITSGRGASIKLLDATLQTLSYCVYRAITGFIPEKTLKASCFDVKLTTTSGFTRIPYRGKPAELCPDGPRYKALGNSWAVNVFRWVGHRIDFVDKLQSEQAA